MNRNVRFKILSLVTASVWAAAVGTLAQRKKLASKAAVSVALATDPRLVRIQVKGDRAQPTGYIETPTTLSLLPGRRKIRVTRDGYRGHDMVVDGDPGDLINLGSIVLERDEGSTFAKLSVKVDSGPVWLELDDGLARGEHSLAIDDVVVGSEHLLTVHLTRDQLVGRVRCRIVLSDAHVETPLVVTVKRLRGKSGKPDTLKVTPCDKPGSLDKRRAPRQAPTDAGSSDPTPKEALK